MAALAGRIRFTRTGRAAGRSRQTGKTGGKGRSAARGSRSGGGRAPQRTQRHELGIEALVDAAFFLLLLLDEALLLFLAAAVFIELAAQGSGGLGRVLAVELHLAIDLDALGLQLLYALARQVGDLVGLRQGLGAFGVVRGLVGIARNQRALARALLAHTALFGL